MSEGMKFDNEKLRYDLFPAVAHEEIIKVLTYGAKKYAPDNWRKVENYYNRYYAAALRHLIAHQKGEKVDEESGLNHLAHAACCIIFMLTKDIEGE